MSDLYKKDYASKQAQMEAHRKLQKMQLELLDEDGKLKRMEHSLDQKKKELDQTKRLIEKLELDVLNAQKKATDIQKELGTAERDVSIQKSHIRKMEYDTEQYREKSYRRDKNSDLV